MKISDKGLALIRKHEGLRLEPYVCAGGELTIGYGHAIPRGQVFGKINKSYAETLLRQDVARAETALDRLVDIPLTKAQVDALVSFVFNVGEKAFAASTLLKKLNGGDYLGAADEFLRWVHAGGKKLPGLIKRREEERALFLTT